MFFGLREFRDGFGVTYEGSSGFRVQGFGCLGVYMGLGRGLREVVRGAFILGGSIVGFMVQHCKLRAWGTEEKGFEFWFRVQGLGF